MVVVLESCRRAAMAWRPRAARRSNRAFERAWKACSVAVRTDDDVVSSEAQQPCVWARPGGVLGGRARACARLKMWSLLLCGGCQGSDGMAMTVALVGCCWPAVVWPVRRLMVLWLKRMLVLVRHPEEEDITDVCVLMKLGVAGGGCAAEFGLE